MIMIIIILLMMKITNEYWDRILNDHMVLYNNNIYSVYFMIYNINIIEISKNVIPN